MKSAWLPLTLLVANLGCDIEVQNDKNGGPSILDEDPYCTPDNYYRHYCTEVRGQIFYTPDEILNAPVIHGDLYFKYRLTDYQAFLVGEEHAYSTYVSSTGEFFFQEVEPGNYRLIMRLVPSYQSDLFYDCTYNPDLHVCVRDPQAEPYRLGVVRNITLRLRERITLPLARPQKLYYHNNILVEVQEITADNSAPKIPVYTH